MKLWEEAVVSTLIVIVLLLGISMAVFGIAGFSFVHSTGYVVQDTGSWSVFYGAFFVIGVLLVYLGMQNAPK